MSVQKLLLDKCVIHLHVTYLLKHKSVPEAWEGRFATPEYELVMAKDQTELMHIDFEDGETLLKPQVQKSMRLFLTVDNLGLLVQTALSLHMRKKGIIPGLLERWYAERKELQAKAREAREEGGDKFAFWDKRQLVKKINLNSLYGALLNPGSRFFDSRLGQSTTLTGRSIAKHMASKVNEVIAGKYDHVGDAIVYGDTDSVYFSAYPVLKDQIDKNEIQWDKDTITSYYEAVCEEVNTTFPNFMNKAFHTTVDLGAIIAAGREISAQSGIFITKKRYAALVYDNEGKREDINGKPGKVKAMGLDLKRSDTPAFMQDFLSELLMMTLTDAGEEAVIKRIVEFRKEFRSMESWLKGTPKRVNNLTKFRGIVSKYEKAKNTAIRDGRSAKDIKKPALPGHVRAALNWNQLCQVNNDKYSIEITDGMKTIVCKLKENPMGMTSVGYPTDETRLPQWFQELPFDDDLMEETIITKKLENLLGVLKWDLDAGAARNTFSDLFDFG